MYLPIFNPKEIYFTMAAGTIASLNAPQEPPPTLRRHDGQIAM